MHVCTFGMATPKGPTGPRVHSFVILESSNVLATLSFHLNNEISKCLVFKLYLRFSFSIIVFKLNVPYA